MQENVNNTISLLDKINIKFNNYMYTLSIAKEVVDSKNSSSGILIIGMIIVIIGLVGYMLSKNK